MEYLVGAGVFYLVGVKLLGRHQVQQSQTMQANQSNLHLNFNDYTRDDVGNDLALFNPDTAEQDIKQMNAIIGDYQYQFGPQLDNAHDYFQPYSFYNHPPIAVVSPAHYYM